MPHYSANTPKDVVEVLRILRSEIGRVTDLWHTWKAMYRSGQANIDLLNELAGPFAADHSHYHFQTVVLGITHLLEQPQVSHQEQCCLAQLQNFPDETIPAELRVKVNKLRSAAIQHTSTIRTVRDNFVAHRALDHLSGTAEKVPPIPWDDVDVAIEQIQQIYNAIVEHFEGKPESFDGFVESGRKTGKQLLGVFADAKHCRDDHTKERFAEFKARQLSTAQEQEEKASSDSN